jgi:hypothetical protein
MNWQEFLSTPAAGPVSFGEGLLGALVIAVWTLFWKGMALWRAGQKGDKNWFIALLVINTVGILEILYLYVFSKKSSSPTQS